MASAKKSRREAGEFSKIVFNEELQCVARGCVASSSPNCKLSVMNITAKWHLKKSVFLRCLFVLNLTGVACFGDQVSDLHAKACNAYMHGDYEVAIDCYTRLVQLKSTDVLFSRAMAYYQIKKYDEAIADLNKLINGGSSVAEHFMLRGEAYAGKGDHTNELADYTKAIDLKPDCAQFYKARAEAYLFFSDHIDAGLIDCHTFFLLASPDSANAKKLFSEAYFDLGYALESKGNYEAAITSFSKSIARDPQYEESYSHRGLIFAMRGEYGKASSDYEQAINIEPDSILAINQLSWFLATCPDDKYRDGQKALANVRKLCERTEWKNSDVLNTYAAACAEVGNFVDAIKFEQIAIETALYDRQVKSESKWLELYKERKPCRDLVINSH